MTYDIVGADAAPRGDGVSTVDLAILLRAGVAVAGMRILVPSFAATLWFSVTNIRWQELPARGSVERSRRSRS